ncbi:MAG: two-component sensor histidine kinase, partial [Lachnospiraceae bacterium]|nr:two-component sensor histidine kinase [Lachnospiraceae bacterium]
MIERLKQMYRRSRFMRSMRIRIFLIILIVGSIPCAVIHIGLVSSYEMRAVNQRMSDVRTQMKVLANHLIYYDYLSDPSSESINAELDQFSTLNDGRVLVINAGLKVVKDTYGISEGKTIVTEEIVRCLKYGSDGTVSLYDKNNGYIELTTPIVETASLEAGDYSSKTVEERVRGVLLTSVSTDSIAATREVLSRRGLLLETIMLLVVFSMALLLSGMLVRPFRRLVRAAGEVRSGFSGSVEPVNSYVETQAIVEAFNRVLARDRVLDESREEFV